MAKVPIPPGLLSPSDEQALQNAVDEAVRVKKRNGWISLSRFKDIIKKACTWIWDLIENLVVCYNIIKIERGCGTKKSQAL